MIEIDKQAFYARLEKLVASVADRKVIFGMLEPRLVGGDPEQMTLEVAYPAKQWEHNGTGAVHGGITATMLDTTMGCLTLAVTGCLSPTVSLSVNFCRPSPGNGVFHVRAKVDMAGAGVICVSGEVWDSRAPDKLLATAQGVFRHTDMAFPFDYGMKKAEKAKENP